MFPTRYFPDTLPRYNNRDSLVVKVIMLVGSSENCLSNNIHRDDQNVKIVQFGILY